MGSRFDSRAPHITLRRGTEQGGERNACFVRLIFTKFMPNRKQCSIDKFSRLLIDASSAFTDGSRIFHPPLRMVRTSETDFATSPRMVRTSEIDFVTSPRMVRTSYFHFVTSPRMVRTSYFRFQKVKRIANQMPYPSVSSANPAASSAKLPYSTIKL